MSKPTWGGMGNWSLAIIVILVAFGLKFWTKGVISSASVLLGMIVAYCCYFYGKCKFSGVEKALGLLYQNHLNMDLILI